MEPLEYNFDELAELADSNLDKFNAKRHLLISELISNAPAELQSRLQNLQNLIDGIRMENKDPIETCCKLFQLIQITLDGENGLTDHLSELRNMLSPINDEDVS